MNALGSTNFFNKDYLNEYDIILLDFVTMYLNDREFKVSMKYLWNMPVMPNRTMVGPKMIPSIWASTCSWISRSSESSAGAMP